MRSASTGLKKDGTVHGLFYLDGGKEGGGGSKWKLSFKSGHRIKSCASNKIFLGYKASVSGA